MLHDVLPSIVDALLRLSQDHVIPKVSLHGSIPAFGDLSPLAYIPGVLEDKASLDA